MLLNRRHSATRLGSYLIISGGIRTSGILQPTTLVLDLITERLHSLTAQEDHTTADEASCPLLDNKGSSQIDRCEVCAILVSSEWKALRAHQIATVQPSAALGVSAPVVVFVGGWMSVENMAEISNNIISTSMPHNIPQVPTSSSLSFSDFFSLGAQHRPGITILQYESPVKKVSDTSSQEY